jgi:hypothetical protein
MLCEARKTFLSCAAHGILDWIPAFAGMTARFAMASTWSFSSEH